MPVTTRKKMTASSAERESKGGKTGGLRNDLKRFTRERILAAAMTSFQEIGFKETTVERIVELAGTTAPTFYRHFNGKDDLLTPLQAHLSVLVQSCLDRLTARDIVSAQALTRWVGDYMRMWGEVHRLCKAFWDAASLEEENDKQFRQERRGQRHGKGDEKEAIRLLVMRQTIEEGSELRARVVADEQCEHEDLNDQRRQRIRADRLPTDRIRAAGACVRGRWHRRAS